MDNERILNWDGCKNVRDLGGLHTIDGRTTRWKAVVRSDTPANLTPVGWSALYTYGIRTIITLYTNGMKEDALDIKPSYPDLATIRVAIEDVTDPEFVRLWASSDRYCTPLYYKDALQRWPERHAEVLSAVAQARPGGVLIHCVRGNDRTGIITLLLLLLVGVKWSDILGDYLLSPDPDREEILTREHSSVPEALLGAVDGLNIDEYLGMGGVSGADLSTVRRRLLG